MSKPTHPARRALLAAVTIAAVAAGSGVAIAQDAWPSRPG